MNCIFITRIIVFNLIIFLSLFIGCKPPSGDCSLVVIEDISGKFWVNETSGKFKKLRIDAKIRGDSDPDCKFTLNGLGMQEYSFDWKRHPELICDKEKSFDWELTSFDLKDLNGDDLEILPSAIYFKLDYTKYVSEEPFTPAVQNSCVLESPAAPKLRPGNFVSDANNCYCPLTIEYNNSGNIQLLFYDGQDVNAENQVDAPPREITTDMLEKTEFANQYMFRWKPTSRGRHVLQLGLISRSGGICIQSDQALSSIHPIDNIPCINPTVNISSIKKSNGSVIGNADIVAPKIDGPFTIDVYAKTDDVEKPSSITVTISYDRQWDWEKKAFYDPKNSNSAILRSIKYVPPAKTTDCIYTVSWDGRDGFERRILLGGAYTVTATARFTQEVSWSSKIRIAPPNYVNVGVDYPGTDPSDIAKNISDFKNGQIEFTKISFLRGKESVYGDFEWLRKLSILSSQVNVGKFNRMDEGGAVTIDQDRLNRIQKHAAWFCFLGHAGIQRTDPVGGYLLFNSGSHFISKCTSTLYGDVCNGGNLCMDYKCDGTINNMIFDDVLLVVLNACRTNLGDGSGGPSVSEIILNQGADCVISTKVKILLMMESFWHQRFTEKLFVDQIPISVAASAAFDEAVTDIAKFYTSIPDDALFATIQNALGMYNDPVYGDCYWLYSFAETFERTECVPNVLNERMTPARFGKPTIP